MAFLSLTEISAFRPNEGTPRERKETTIPGELQICGEKPVRILNNFAFFSRGRDVFAELDEITRDGYSSVIEGIGEVLAAYGDEMPGEDEDVEEPALLHLTPIINASIDYEKHNECVAFLCHRIRSLTMASPFYVETKHAWYRLGVPSTEYFPLYVRFYTFHRMAQIAVSSLLANISATAPDLLAGTTNLDYTILGREPNVRDLVETVCSYF